MTIQLPVNSFSNFLLLEIDSDLNSIIYIGSNIIGYNLLDTYLFFILCFVFHFVTCTHTHTHIIIAYIIHKPINTQITT